jgi:transposase
LRRRVEELQAENARLKQALEEARRAGKRQAGPFSKGPPKAKPNKRGRRPGDSYGKKAHRPLPGWIDQDVNVPLPGRCPHCGSDDIEPDDLETQYQSDLPPAQRPYVTAFHVQRGHCRRCRRPVRARDPRQNSQARGAAASHVGPRAIALAAHLNKELGLSFGKICILFASLFDLPITRGALAQAMARVAHKLAPTYDALVQSLPSAPVVTPDETGWRVDGRSAWLWVFVTPKITVYAICPGRGMQDATSVLPADYLQ